MSGSIYSMKLQLTAFTASTFDVGTGNDATEPGGTQRARFSASGSLVVW